MFSSGRPQRLRSSGSKLLQICILRSGGRLHAHGMAKFLLYSFIAQQSSVLASFCLMVLFIAGTMPCMAGEVVTLFPCDLGVLQTCG
jgi:hypothetical protein